MRQCRVHRRLPRRQPRHVVLCGLLSPCRARSHALARQWRWHVNVADSIKRLCALARVCTYVYPVSAASTALLGMRAITPALPIPSSHLPLPDPRLTCAGMRPPMWASERRQMHDAAHNRTVTFLPENDMMGHMFDSHGGLVQTMTCNTDHLGPVGCHLLENTICNLISHCGERGLELGRRGDSRGSCEDVVIAGEAVVMVL